MDEDEDWTPFWVQETADRRRTERLRHRATSMFFSSGLLIMLLMVTAVFFLVFIVPSTISFTTQVFKPISVRKSWDSINVVLVLFALVFGFLSRNKNEENYNSPKTSTRFGEIDYSQSRNELKRSNPTTPHQWYGYSPRDGRRSNPSTPHGYSDSGNVFGGGGGGGLRRTYSSYPDLRGWSNELAYNDPWRFNDDTVLQTGSDKLLLHRGSFKEVEQQNVTNSVLEAFETHQSVQKSSRDNTTKIKNIVHIEQVMNLPIKEPSLDPPPPPPQQTTLPPPPPQPEPEPEPLAEQPKIQHRPRRIINQSSGQKGERRRKKRDNVVEQKNTIDEPTTPPPPPPPPPPPLPPPSYYMEQNTSKFDKKRGGTSATKEFLNSLYHKKKKKKQRAKSIENLDSLFHKPQPQATYSHLPPPSPPPPPPPPPPPFFHMFSSKKSKKPRTEKTSLIPPKPHVTSFQSVSEKPILPRMMSIPLPPPPPPPPPQYYKPAWKFVMQGDYVRIDSFSSSEPTSDVDSDVVAAAEDGGALASPTLPPLETAFCPSPDVNTKAERFISRFRAGLKLEKINSMKKQDELGLGLGSSNLGPNKGPK
ncbi:hypothetical protein Leryth_011404 [Lithospermum erythrorhizon]|nr:hypothetical protein Leryth_011404 [Lithospermum erythrorhizon]